MSDLNLAAPRLRRIRNELYIVMVEMLNGEDQAKVLEALVILDVLLNGRCSVSVKLDDSACEATGDCPPHVAATPVRRGSRSRTG